MTIDGEASRSHTAVGANKRLDELDLFCGLVERAQESSELLLPARTEPHYCMAVSVLGQTNYAPLSAWHGPLGSDDVLAWQVLNLDVPLSVPGSIAHYRAVTVA